MHKTPSNTCKYAQRVTVLLFALETHRHTSQVTEGGSKLRAAQSSKPARERHSLQNGLPCVFAISKLPSSMTSLKTSPARAVFDFVCLAKASPGGESIVHERDVLLKFAATISPGASLSLSTNLH